MPDILTLSKTLGNGIPMAATVTSDEIEEECFDKKNRLRKKCGGTA